MSLAKGAVNFSVLRSSTSIDTRKLVDELANEAYKNDQNPSPDEPVYDTSSGISLMPPKDKQVTADDFLYESHPFFAIRSREMKIDSSLLKEIIARAIEEKKAELNVDVIKGKALKEIRNAAKAILADKAAIKVAGTRAAYSPTGFFYVESTSVKKSLSFIESLAAKISLDVLGSVNPVDFNYIAASLKFNPAQYEPMRFSEHEITTGLGEDFLTWLLATSETSGLPDGFSISVPGAIEMTDCSTSSAGAKVVTMKDGIPSAGKEIVTCISSGKKVSSLEMVCQFGQAAFEATIDINFCVKKFKAVKGDEEEAEETFTDRITDMDTFVKGMVKLFSHFIEMVRNDQASVEASIKTWAAGKS